MLLPQKELGQKLVEHPKQYIEISEQFQLNLNMLKFYQSILLFHIMKMVIIILVYLMGTPKKKLFMELLYCNHRMLIYYKAKEFHCMNFQQILNLLKVRTMNKWEIK